MRSSSVKLFFVCAVMVVVAIHSNNIILIVFILYLVCMLGIGLHFFLKQKGRGEKAYFLGDRQVSGLVAALSAGASDMSSWVLMGLPGALYLTGLVEIWTAVGLAVGQALSWILVSQRLRRFSIAAKDSITIPAATRSCRYSAP